MNNRGSKIIYYVTYRYNLISLSPAAETRPYNRVKKQIYGELADSNTFCSKLIINMIEKSFE